MIRRKFFTYRLHPSKNVPNYYPQHLLFRWIVLRIVIRTFLKEWKNFLRLSHLYPPTYLLKEGCYSFSQNNNMSKNSKIIIETKHLELYLCSFSCFVICNYLLKVYFFNEIAKIKTNTFYSIFEWFNMQVFIYIYKNPKKNLCGNL